MDYNTVLLSPDDTAPFIEKFHVFGHGIANGLSETEHLRRIMRETQGLLGLLILHGTEPVGMVTLLPYTAEDSHFQGTGIVCVHFAGHDLGVRGMRTVHQSLRRLAQQEGAGWYSLSSRVSQYEYRNRYYMIGD